MHILFIPLRNLVFFLPIVFGFLQLKSQEEHTFGSNLQLNSRGFSVVFNVLQQSSKRSNNLYELSIGNVKDAKEIRISNLDMVSNIAPPGVFTYGKVNSLYALRLGYGKEITLAPRPNFNAVGLIWSCTGGVNIGVQSPTFIDYYMPGATDYSIQTVRYNPEIHERRHIIQSKNFFRGLNQASILPSIYIKQGIVVEFGNYTYAPNKIEAGFMIDAYFIRPELMYLRTHPTVFTSFYISFAILNIET